ncbi:hypothetical protein J6590_100572, partial [Homalodisca vitripennis]
WHGRRCGNMLRRDGTRRPPRQGKCRGPSRRQTGQWVSGSNIKVTDLKQFWFHSRDLSLDYWNRRTVELANTTLRLRPIPIIEH